MMGYGDGYGSGGYGGGYGNMMSNGGWLVGLMMLFFGVLFIALVVLLIVWAVRAAGGHGKQHHIAVPPVASGPTHVSTTAAHDEAVAIARRRLASGEISPEQYAEIVRHLGG